MEKNILGMHISSFPDKSNTFVVNEIAEMAKRGVKIKIYCESIQDCSLFPFLEKLIRDGDVELIDTISENLFKWKCASDNRIPLFDNTYRQVLKNKSHLKESVERCEEEALERCERVFKNFAERIQQDGVSVLYSPFASHDADICMMLSKITQIPFFFSCHSRDLFSSFHYGIPKCRRVKGIFCITNYNREFLNKGFAVEKERLHIKRVNFLEKKEVKKFSPGFEYIYSAGRLCEMKGFEYSIKAFKRLLKKKGNEGLRYIISGSGSLKPELKNLINSLDLEGKVHIEDHLSNEAVLSYIKGSLFCLLTSIISPDGDREGLPTFFIESMSLGKPCIGTNYSGIPEIIDHGKNGFTCEPKNVADIFQSMHKLIDMVRNSNDSVERSCKKKIYELFDNNLNTSVLIDKMFPNL